MSEAKRSGPRKKAGGARARVRGRGYKWKVPCRACERQGRRPVYAADGTLALGGRPWVRNHIRQRRSRDLLAEWIYVKLISLEELSKALKTMSLAGEDARYTK